MKRQALIAAAVIAVIAVAALLWHFNRNPGPLRVDNQGVVHGSGRKVYRYQNGANKLIEDYANGKQSRSEWFRPDGTSILVTEWKDESGVGLILREDGSVRQKATYVKGIANGTVTYYARDGTVKGEAMFHDGQRVSGYEPDPNDSDK